MSNRMKNLKIEIKDNEYSLNLQQDDLNSFKVLFQNKLLSLKNLDLYYMKQIESKYGGNIGYEIEVLPSVYYKKKAFLKKVVSPHDITLLFQLLYNSLYSRQKFNITINVRNIRDSFKIFRSNETLEENGYYSEPSCNKENKYLNPTDLPYPDTLGKGAGRCVIWSLFSNLGMLDWNDEKYIILEHERMFEVSRYSKKLLDYCYNSSHCGEIIKKMKQGKYEAKFETNNDMYDDDIKVEFRDGKYRLNEGKHRVCMAKRFDIKSIPVEVTTVINNKGSFNQSRYKTNLYNKKLNCEDILTECYNKYDKLGFTKKDVRKLNETVRDNEFVNFIEQTKKKDIKDFAIETGD